MTKVSFLTFFFFFVISFKGYAAIQYQNDIIKDDIVWEKEIIIAGKVMVDRKATIIIKPGTRIVFKKIDNDNDGLSETSIIVNGNIICEGTAENPVYFTSFEQNKDWGDWKEIQINHAKKFIFNYAIFEYSEYGIHVHFSEGVIKNSIFRKNGDATRLGNSVLTFTNNLFENNHGKALNFTNCNIIFVNNTIRHNREGVFVFEKVGKAQIERNNFYNNMVNVKTGDFFRDRLELGKNFFNETGTIQSDVRYENAEKPYYGILPDIKDAYLSDIIETEGFIDGGAGSGKGSVFFSSFDGNIYRYYVKERVSKKYFVGDFLDCTPLVHENYLIASNWAGRVVAIDIDKNNLLWELFLDKDLKDDHRMPSPVLFDNNVVIARPDGKVYLVDIKTGKQIKKIILEDELRATPVVLADKLYLFGVNGNVFVINLVTDEIKKIKLDAAFYSKPLIYNDLLAIVDKNGRFFMINRRLEIKKELQLNSTFRHQSPVVFDGSVYLFSLDGDIISIKDRTNREKLNLIFTATPLIWENFVVAPTFDGRLLFYSGDRKFFLTNFGEIQFEPYLYEDYIFLGTRSGKIYVIKPW